MGEQTDVCLYHRDRGEFNTTQRNILKSGWISQKYIHRLAMAVCSCRRHLKGSQYIHDYNSLQSAITYLRDVLNRESSTHRCSEQLRIYIINCINDANTTDYSLCKFIDILYEAKHGDFSSLEREKKKSDILKTEEEEERKAVSKKKKLTQNQIACMLRKRKKKMETAVVKLPMFPGNFPKLVSENEVKDYMEKDGCFVEACNSLNDKSFKDNKNETYVKVWAKESECLENLQICLVSQASAIQNTLDRQRQERRSQLKQQKVIVRRSWQEIHEEDEGNEDLMDDLKYIKHNDFDRKALKSKQNKSSKSTSSVLDKGHCLHCHKEFSNLRDRSICKHHSGFLVNGAWSCCGTQIEDHRMMKTPSYTDHHTTGCVEAVCHVWRVHARSDHKERKAGARSDIFSKNGQIPL